MNLKELARARGTNLNKVAEKCGVPASTLYAISSGETNFDNVGIGLFIKIASALDIPTEQLYKIDGSDWSEEVTVACFEESLKEMLHDGEMSDEERELVSLFRRISDDDKPSFMSMARALAFAGDHKKETTGRTLVGD